MISPPIQQAKTNEKISGELRSPGLLAKHPLIGVMLFLLGSLIFGLLAYYVHHNGALAQWDLALVTRVHEMALKSPAWMKNIMLAGFYIGLQGYILLGLLLGLYFLFKKFWEEFFMVAILFAGEGVLWHYYSAYFARMRPEFTDRIGSVLHYPSFPSGHTFSAVVGCGLIAYLLVPIISSRFWKAMVIILAVLMVLFISYSRFFMGAHYLTDIVAGLAAGVAWTSLVIMSIELLYKKGDNKHVEKNEI